MSEHETPTPTPRCRRVLEDSAELARELGHSYIGVGHLFLAIVRDRAAVPAQVLARITDLDRVEASVREELASPGYTGEPPAGAVWLSVTELPDLLPALARCVAPGLEYVFNVVGTGRGSSSVSPAAQQRRLPRTGPRLSDGSAARCLKAGLRSGSACRCAGEPACGVDLAGHTPVRALPRRSFGGILQVMATCVSLLTCTATLPDRGGH